MGKQILLVEPDYYSQFPPSEALKTKFNSSRNFEEVFKLREQK